MTSLAVAILAFVVVAEIIGLVISAVAMVVASPPHRRLAKCQGRVPI
jgi:hypothetical protein